MNEGFVTKLSPCETALMDIGAVDAVNAALFCQSC